MYPHLIGLACCVCIVAVGCEGSKPQPNPPTPPAQTQMPPPKNDQLNRDVAKKRLREILAAWHAYEEQKECFPTNTAPNNGIGLSWRVMILPYLKQEALFKKFKLDEPWDSETNKPLLAEMPDVYASPGKATSGKTHLRSIVGKHATLPDKPLGMTGLFPQGRKFLAIPDGLTNTFAVAEAQESVEWTKADDLMYAWTPTDRNPPLPLFGGVFEGGFHAATLDGAAWWMPSSTNEKFIRSCLTIGGAEIEPWPNLPAAEPDPTPAAPQPKQDASVTADSHPSKDGQGQRSEAAKTPPMPAKPVRPDEDQRQLAQKRLKEISFAWLNYANDHNHLPSNAMPKQGVGLSWRVMILPYLKQEALFKKFKLDEPWDSETNKPLLAEMPDVYTSPGKTIEKGMTHIRSFVGPHAIIPEKPLGMKGLLPMGRQIVTDVRDGTANILLAVEATEAVEWTKANDLPFPWTPMRRNVAIPKLGGVFEGGFHGALVVGTSGWINDTLSEEVIRAAITINGEDTDFDKPFWQLIDPPVQMDTRDRKGGSFDRPKKGPTPDAPKGKN